ncbi:Histidine kinase [Saccharicrinis carchari]|uniref:Histidine kinase n=1 Tax=Saccharicrinis carchari TaxID=1168039 RepID=A0A521B7L6_SACCC|nr:histidine kinase [Saccharicrinis carchari]SMO43055.1 Histidine kinase [Saccharicrinis carchari]
MQNSRFKIFLVPLVVILIITSSMLFMLFFGHKNLDDLTPYMPLGKVTSIIIQACIIVAVFYFVVRFLNKKLPWNKRWLLRLLLDIALVLAMAFAGISLLLYIESNQIFPMGMGQAEKEFIYFIPILMNALYLVIIETMLAIDERNKLVDKLNKMEQLHLKTKYGALKAQLDHHFLFNNLSVLSSIIYEDVEKADKFIQRFSQIYRYVLTMNKKDLVLLSDEINFINSYLELYKCRFEEGFDYQMKVDADKLSMLIAPLTLQVLVENAIKHNVVSRCRPLCINIFNCENTLVVKNNLQKRDGSDIDSMLTGQNNINQKYELLNYPRPNIHDDGEFYAVHINLIPQNNG